jgi:hypothetical protein
MVSNVSQGETLVWHGCAKMTRIMGAAYGRPVA